MAQTYLTSVRFQFLNDSLSDITEGKSYVQAQEVEETVSVRWSSGESYAGVDLTPLSFTRLISDWL